MLKHLLEAQPFPPSPPLSCLPFISFSSSSHYSPYLSFYRLTHPHASLTGPQEKPETFDKDIAEALN
jgi:hypothetical protein